MVGGKEEDRPHPSLLPQEKESLFPHLVNLGASRLRLIQWPLIRPVRRFASAFASLRRDTMARQAAGRIGGGARVAAESGAHQFSPSFCLIGAHGCSKFLP